MALRYEQFYKINRLDNLGDPDYWGRRFQDIDRRLHSREIDADKIDNAVDQIQAVALARLNDTFTPIINQALERLSVIGAAFNATSSSEITVSVGVKNFVIDEDVRASFIVSDYVTCRPQETDDVGFVASVTSYEASTGLLIANALEGFVSGTGTYTGWLINLSPAPNLDSYTRAQTDAEIDAVGAEVDAKIAELDGRVATVVGGAVPGLDTLTEIAAAIANDPNYAGTVTAALNNRVRTDAAQGLGAVQKAQARSNIGAGETIAAGTSMLFVQSSAPLGWTKSLTHNNKALRVVNTAAGSGGNLGFTSAFGRLTTDSFTLSTPNLPSHTHGLGILYAYEVGAAAASIGGGNDAQTNAAGSGFSFTMGMDIRVQYVDVIIAIKD